jgi:hypothetical protein
MVRYVLLRPLRPEIEIQLEQFLGSIIKTSTIVGLYYFHVHEDYLLKFSIIFSHSTLRTKGNKLVINLSVANLLMHIKGWVIITNGAYGGPILGEFGNYISIY